ncbi:amidohydrolase family protein [Yoonia sp. BS5-3]|uniref:Amidohydrolase n=1 Tax=Yoonia phaeophyticola TaxID=3137369 RepID=A0ABZ2V5Q4_9RHOB
MIDAHHHIWRQADLPWLLGPEQPRIFGPYAPIKRDYPIEEYIKDVKKSGITGSVYVQVNWAPNWALDEARWVQAEGKRTGWPMGIVAYADMTSRHCAAQLKALSDIPEVRGIRHQFHWHENPLYRFAPHADLCEDSQVQANVGLLADYGFSFDLQVFARQMPGAVKLVKANPQVTFILQHAGMLEDKTKATRKLWLDGMTALAKCRNTVCKLSGLGTFLHKNDTKHITDQIGVALDLFGAERCMFGSNFPIEKLWTSFPKLIGAHLKAVPETDHQSVFSQTAARVYRLKT